MSANNIYFCNVFRVVNDFNDFSDFNDLLMAK